jgi:prevent-host-death family protein
MKNDSNEPINEVMELKKCTNFSMICTEQKQIPYEISGDPIMKTITATELKNALGAYLEEAKKGETLIITKDGKEICEIRSLKERRLALFDSLTGVASDVDPEEAKAERRLAL